MKEVSRKSVVYDFEDNAGILLILSSGAYKLN